MKVDLFQYPVGHSGHFYWFFCPSKLAKLTSS